MSDPRESSRRRERMQLTLVALLILLLLSALWLRSPLRGSLRSGASAPTQGAATPTQGVTAAQSAPVGGQSQPAPEGYVYRVSTERYLVPQENGKLQLQHRQRESWTAPDGWAWARQTGNDQGDPASFIFAPDTDWQRLRRQDPTVAGVQQAMHQALPGPASDLPEDEFNFVYDLLATESLPASALPTSYRAALVAALAGNAGMTLTRHAHDPLGRESTRITWSGKAGSASGTLTLYLDDDYQFLAYTEQFTDGSRGSRIITDQRHVGSIPKDLLAKVGSKRVAKVMWS